jgi:hypothetical protein
MIMLFLLIVVFFAPYPFPIKLSLQETISPDKTQKAAFYWRAHGGFGLITKAEPWVYLEITKQGDEKAQSYSIWGDTPCDGVKRLKGNVPWEFDVCKD